jgi:glycosyltransferase involved in cell wall biosynthesis
VKTTYKERAGAAAEPLAKACSAERRQKPKGAGRSLEHIADEPQLRPGRGTREATQEHGRARAPEGVRRRARDPRGERRGGAAGLVTVVIPCYNQAHFLGEAIESVLGQSYPYFEVVVVDDGSPDKTSEVAARYPGVRLIRQDNQGLAAARNSGLAQSEGDYLVFLDADDRLLPEALEAHLDCFGTHPGCAFVSGHIRRIATDGSLLGTPRQALHRAHVEGDHYLGLLYYNSVWIPGSVMYRRAVFDSVGGFDTTVNGAADYDLYLRIARVFPVHHHGEVVLEYRRHAANMTRDPAPMLKATVTVLRRQRKHVKGNKRYKEAYRTGMRTGQEIYGVPLSDEVRNHSRLREWKRAVQGILVLLRYYPRGLTLLLNEWRGEQRKLALRLRTRQQELQAREQQLRLYELRLRALNEQPGNRGRQVEELESALAKERQEVQWLRRRTQRLALRIQELDRRAQYRRISIARKLSRGARAPGRTFRRWLSARSASRSDRSSGG